MVSSSRLTCLRTHFCPAPPEVLEVYQYSHGSRFASVHIMAGRCEVVPHRDSLKSSPNVSLSLSPTSQFLQSVTKNRLFFLFYHNPPPSPLYTIWAKRSRHPQFSSHEFCSFAFEFAHAGISITIFYRNVFLFILQDLLIPFSVLLPNPLHF